MEKINCEVTVETRISKKTNNPYTVMVLRFQNGYEKLVFLDQAEQFMFLPKK